MTATYKRSWSQSEAVEKASESLDPQENVYRHFEKELKMSLTNETRPTVGFGQEMMQLVLVNYL